MRFRRSPRSSYDEHFFRDQAAVSAASAAVAVPAIMEICSPASVIDVGCGTGIWLAEFISQGVTDICGYDAVLPPSESLRLPAEHVRQADLTRPLTPGRHFDLALCLEVAEHLSEDGVETLIDSLVGAAPIVVFSAAVPHQGGTHHVNEQWQSWWAGKFAPRGYRPSLALRRAIWASPGVASYYAQNAIIYFDAARAATGSQLADQAPERFEELDVIHPRMWERRAGHPWLSVVRASVPAAIRRRVSSRVRARLDYFRRI